MLSILCYIALCHKTGDNMKRTILLLIVLLLNSSLAVANSKYTINSNHLKAIKDVDNAIYIPVEQKFIPSTPDQQARGVKGRLLVSWGKIQSGEFETTLHKYDEDGQETSESDLNAVNKLLKDQLELQNSNLISVEYFITDSLSIELADNYQEYGLAGETVGEVEQTTNGGLFGSNITTSSIVKLNHIDKIHDFQVGLNYSIEVVKTSNSSLEVALKSSAGLVHLDTKTEIDSVVGDELLNEYSGLAGYSYGGGIRARYSYKSFFIQGGVDHRQYVLAPMSNDDGSSSEIHQRGTVVSFSFGFRF